MSDGNATTFLDLAVGPFRLALRANCVLAVVSDVEAGEVMLFRGEELPLADLYALHCRKLRPVIPFAVAFETGSIRAAIGVDRVDHVRLEGSANTRPMPTFGLLWANLFDGILRDPRGLLMLLRESELAQLTTAKLHDI